MQSNFTRLVFVFILYNYLIINEAVVLFRYAVFTSPRFGIPLGNLQQTSHSDLQ